MDIRQHPAYVSHLIMDRYEGFALIKVTYREDNPDYEGGTRLEVWDDNDEYLCDVDGDDFNEIVDDVLAEREES